VSFCFHNKKYEIDYAQVDTYERSGTLNLAKIPPKQLADERRKHFDNVETEKKFEIIQQYKNKYLRTKKFYLQTGIAAFDCFAERADTPCYSCGYLTLSG
jgi:hypothetical protein